LHEVHARGSGVAGRLPISDHASATTNDPYSPPHQRETEFVVDDARVVDEDAVDMVLVVVVEDIVDDVVESSVLVGGALVDEVPHADVTPVSLLSERAHLTIQSGTGHSHGCADHAI
jgi:hypothetical protein